MCAYDLFDLKTNILDKQSLEEDFKICYILLLLLVVLLVYLLSRTGCYLICNNAFVILQINTKYEYNFKNQLPSLWHPSAVTCLLLPQGIHLIPSSLSSYSSKEFHPFDSAEAPE